MAHDAQVSRFGSVLTKSLIALPLLALLLLTGCTSTSQAGIATAGDPATAESGSATPNPSPTSTGDIDEQRLAFAQCMRDNGVPMPDPGSDTGAGGGFREFGDVDRDVLDQAMTACDSLRPAGGGRNNADLSDSDKQKMLDMAACLRGEGFDVPDPTFDGRGGFLRPSPGSTFDRRDDDYRAATEKCRTEVGLDFGQGGQQGGATASPSGATV